MDFAEQALLILILLSGPGDRDLGDVVAQELRRRGGDAVTVLVGDEAHARLREDFAIGFEDLETSRAIGAHLTRSASHVVLVTLGGREMAGDTVLEAVVFDRGSIEPISTIAGDGADPVPALVSNLTRLLRTRLPPADDAGPDAPRRPRDVAALIKREAWRDALAALAERGELGAREHYYRVLAYVRLGRREAAIAALNDMTTDHGQHFLVAAAEDLIPALDAGRAEDGGAADKDSAPADADAEGRDAAEGASASAEAAGATAADTPAATR